MTILSRIYSYGGHLARMRHREPGRLVSHFLNHWSMAQRRDQALANRGHQGHAGVYNHWDWEHLMQKPFSAKDKNWDEVALNHKEWETHRRDWIKTNLGSVKRQISWVHIK